MKSLWNYLVRIFKKDTKKVETALSKNPAVAATLKEVEAAVVAALVSKSEAVVIEILKGSISYLAK